VIKFSNEHIDVP